MFENVQATIHLNTENQQTRTVSDFKCPLPYFVQVEADIIEGEAAPFAFFCKRRCAYFFFHSGHTFWIGLCELPMQRFPAEGKYSGCINATRQGKIWKKIIWTLTH